MNTHPSISVIILNFNGKAYLEQSLPAVLGLVYPSYEVIVVDNGSIDGSIEYISTFPEVRLIRSPRHREKNYACNFAIAASTSDFILLLDNDIVLTDMELLDKLVEFHHSALKPGAIGLAVHDRGLPMSSRYGTYFGYYFIKEVRKYTIEQIKTLHGRVVPATGGQIFIKRELWEQIGGYDDHLAFGGDDNDLGIRLSLWGYRNYLYSQTNQLHIGIQERLDNFKYRRKFAEMFYAHLYTMTKNYGAERLIPSLFIYSGFSLLKALKQSFQRMNIGPFFSFFKGLYLYAMNLKTNLKKRKHIQNARVISDDIFLKILPPEIR